MLGRRPYGGEIMICLAHKYHDETGKYLGREHYDTPGSIRGCECPDCVRTRQLHQAAAAMGRKGGSVKSERKAASSRENGKKGGRPKKKQD